MIQAYYASSKSLRDLSRVSSRKDPKSAHKTLQRSRSKSMPRVGESKDNEKRLRDIAGSGSLDFANPSHLSIDAIDADLLGDITEKIEYKIRDCEEKIQEGKNEVSSKIESKAKKRVELFWKSSFCSYPQGI